MMRKSSVVSLKSFCLMSFTLIISVAFILGMRVTPVQAAKKADERKSVAALVDINSATQKELEDIKGVGPAKAKKIIAGRPYTSVDELSKAGLKAKDIDALKPFITVGKAQAAPVTKAAAKTTSAATGKKAEAQKAVAAGPVDINSASAKELEAIKGIGPAKAKKIITGRPYKSVDDLSKAGLKAKDVEAIKPFVTVGNVQAAPAPAAATATKAPVSAPAKDLTKTKKDVKATSKSTSPAAAKLAPGTKININTADQATIEKLPEIGPVKAKAIIDGRPYNKIEDIMKIKGIKGKTFDVIKDFIVVN